MNDLSSDLSYSFRENSDRISLDWGKETGSATWQVNLNECPVTIASPAQYAPGQNMQATVTLHRQIQIQSPQAIRQFACWILSNISPEAELENMAFCGELARRLIEHYTTRDLSAETRAELMKIVVGLLTKTAKGR